MRLADLDGVVDQLADLLRTATSWHLVMLTSTVPPGTTENRVIPRLEKISGKQCGPDFGVAFSPEFLREGSAIHDYRNPAKTVVGATDSRALDCASAIFSPYTGSITATTIAAAEMAKLTDNAWHALKVCPSVRPRHRPAGARPLRDRPASRPERQLPGIVVVRTDPGARLRRAGGQAVRTRSVRLRQSP